LEYLLPLYRREGKSYLTIGIGCTGGRHRSVMVAESLGKALNQNGFEISVSHRDVKK
jgi:RNase adapter protein RapZ